MTLFHRIKLLVPSTNSSSLEYTIPLNTVLFTWPKLNQGVCLLHSFLKTFCWKSPSSCSKLVVPGPPLGVILGTSMLDHTFRTLNPLSSQLMPSCLWSTSSNGFLRQTRLEITFFTLKCPYTFIFDSELGSREKSWLEITFLLSWKTAAGLLVSTEEGREIQWHSDCWDLQVTRLFCLVAFRIFSFP